MSHEEKLPLFTEFLHFSQPASAFSEFRIFTWVTFCMGEICATTMQDRAKQEMLQIAECYFLFALHFYYHWVIWRRSLLLMPLNISNVLLLFCKQMHSSNAVMQKNCPNETEISRHFLSTEVFATVFKQGGGFQITVLKLLCFVLFNWDFKMDCCLNLAWEQDAPWVSCTFPEF